MPDTLKPQPLIVKTQARQIWGLNLLHEVRELIVLKRSISVCSLDRNIGERGKKHSERGHYMKT